MSYDTEHYYAVQTFLVQQKTTYQCVVMRLTSIALGGMETHLTEKESEIFYSKSTTTSL